MSVTGKPPPGSRNRWFCNSLVYFIPSFRSLLANLVAVLTASMTFERPRLTKANGDDFLTARCTIILSDHTSAPWDSLCTAYIQPLRSAGHVNMNTNCPPGPRDA